VLTLRSTAASRLGGLLLFFGCSAKEPVNTGSVDTGFADDHEEVPIEFTDTEESKLAQLWPFEAPPADPTNAVAEDPAAAHLGQYLFFDTRLSGSGEFSCATCHQSEHGFADPERFSEAAGTPGRHTPTALNTAYNNWFFWDGRCDTHWCQALGPIEAEDEQNTNRLAVVHLIADDADLAQAYEAIFGSLSDLSDSARFPANAKPVGDAPEDPLDISWQAMTEEDQDTVNQIFTNLGKAIAAYERKLIRADAPFDRFAEAYLAGDTENTEISDEAKYGFKHYLGDGLCFACHSGPNFSNNEFHNIALPSVDGIDNENTGRTKGIELLLANPFNGMGTYSDDAPGSEIKLEHLADTPEQNGQFKTASLRNLISTPPYMHGGHFADLTEVVNHYNDMDDRPPIGHREELLFPLDWSDQDVLQMVSFLESLEGAALAPALLEQPTSPIYSD
jgi:cytochrome c peroxidase